MNNSTVAVLSGGMDSAVAMLDAMRTGDVIEAVSFDYGQRHRTELEYAARFAELHGVPHNIVKVPLNTLAPDTALTGDVDVPHGHYAEDNMVLTVVPNRNMTFMALAASRAMSIGAGRLSVGVHAGDHAVYADCRSEFIGVMRLAIGQASEGAVDLLAPFVDVSKRDIALLGEELGMPWHLTWSCYEGGDVHCGRCGTCVERLEALYGLNDETVYADSEFWREQVAV